MARVTDCRQWAVEMVGVCIYKRAMCVCECVSGSQRNVIRRKGVKERKVKCWVWR